MNVEPFLLERFFASHEFTTPHLLSVSDCESMTVGDLLALEPGSREGLDRVWLGYTESDGGSEVRDALAELHPALGPEDFLVHAAGVEEQCARAPRQASSAAASGSFAPRSRPCSEASCCRRRALPH